MCLLCHTDFPGGRCALPGSRRKDGRIREPTPSRLHGAERWRHRHRHDETVGVVQASAEACRTALVVRLQACATQRTRPGECVRASDQPVGLDVCVGGGERASDGHNISHRGLQLYTTGIFFFFLFFSSHYTTPAQCWAQDLARGLNSSRSSWVQGCGRMGQTSRCFIVCLRCLSILVVSHFCIYMDLHRPFPVRRRFRLYPRYTSYHVVSVMALSHHTFPVSSLLGLPPKCSTAVSSSEYR